jgi:hypothetical protein
MTIDQSRSFIRSLMISSCHKILLLPERCKRPGGVSLFTFSSIPLLTFRRKLCILRRFLSSTQAPLKLLAAKKPAVEIIYGNRPCFADK